MESKGENKVEIYSLRDTGASQSLMLNSVIPNAYKLGKESVLISGIHGNYIPIPLININITSKYKCGIITVGLVDVLPIPGIHLILGNDVAGNKVFANPTAINEPESKNVNNIKHQQNKANCVITRAQQHIYENNSIDLSDTFMYNLNNTEDKQKLIDKQNHDQTLTSLFDRVVPKEEIELLSVCYYLDEGLLMRKWRPPEAPADHEWEEHHQIVLPVEYRKDVLKYAHEIPMAGHLGIKKSKDRILQYFFWPNLDKQVKEFCNSCHTCQTIGKPNQLPNTAPLQPIPVTNQPFSRIIIDIVGPLPRTKKGNKYLLTIMDQFSRYPEAIPLKNQSSEEVADALLIFFSRVGIPNEVQSDCGTNFMSELFKTLLDKIDTQTINSTPYRPQSQGCLERFHQTLKSMLAKYCKENSTDWDKGVHLVLFTYLLT